MLDICRIIANLKRERMKSLFHLTKTAYIPDSALIFCKYYKGFSAAMAEALEKLEEEQMLKKQEKEEAIECTKEIKKLKHNLKRRKWVDWKTEDEEKTNIKKASFNPAERVKRKKTAILLGYSGANYFGMQRNPGMPTIEEELFKAMFKHKWVTEDMFEQAQLASFQRAARTDKGVSAARQVCSIKLPLDLDVDALNADLPDQIRLFGIERVTKGFNAKDQCNARTYTYTMPSIAFGDSDYKGDLKSFRLLEENLKKAQEVLQMFEGTKNFHNFTSKKHFIDPSAKRFIMSFISSKPFMSPQGVEFITLKIKGQSFMLHQIRKMVGLAIAIVRGHTDVTTLERALTEERIDLPMAPGLGLVLDTVHYERYNNRYGQDGIHNPLTWEKQEPEIRNFIEKYIFANIYQTECEQKPLLEWLETLAFHSYDTRKEDNSSNEGEVCKEQND